MTTTAKPIHERAAELADPDTRKWSKAADVAGELEEAAEHARTLADAIDELAEALAAKDGAMELSPSERGDELADAWDNAVSALATIGESLEVLVNL